MWIRVAARSCFVFTRNVVRPSGMSRVRVPLMDRLGPSAIHREIHVDYTTLRNYAATVVGSASELCTTHAPPAIRAITRRVGCPP